MGVLTPWEFRCSHRCGKTSEDVVLTETLRPVVPQASVSGAPRKRCPIVIVAIAVNATDRRPNDCVSSWSLSPFVIFSFFSRSSVSTVRTSNFGPFQVGCPDGSTVLPRTDYRCECVTKKSLDALREWWVLIELVTTWKKRTKILVHGLICHSLAVKLLQSLAEFATTNSWILLNCSLWLDNSKTWQNKSTFSATANLQFPKVH